MIYLKKYSKLIELSFFACLMLIFNVSCNDDIDNHVPIKEDTVPFERHPNLLFSRADVGNLEVIGDRLYYSNVSNPGYFDSEGIQHQFSMRSFDMRFSHSFSDNLTAGVLNNRNSLVIMPNYNYASNNVVALTPLNIPNLPLDAQLKEGWLEVPNFAFNENFIISSWERNLFFPGIEPIDNTFILELNVVNSSFGPHVDRQLPVLRKILLDLEIDGRSRLDLITAYSWEDGWIISGSISGLQNSFFVTKEGKATPLRNIYERFVILSLIKGPEGELFLTTEDEIFYSPDGDIFNLISIASSNQFLRIQFIQDRLITWAGRDNFYEILNYKDPENIEITELENLGLQGLWVKDIEFFNNQVYVSTNGGLFLKGLEDFWTVKEESVNEASVEIGWELSK
ncbi:hypothetical protein SAMN00777080_4280 [Aquiflexum balticum DSM 16537]|uniref:Uncharacterized protein n=1 Tax=Aquiflexum balticum DSM 16537 TaxID=758820 RepID=A0A1W2HA67_9BACT|nr:hypothetical protein [Aquiflexum balticum]SMD45622.1 hypothetical protein SAMN00777080_4280 [Aquiflexum balticum DSM 16537]